MTGGGDGAGDGDRAARIYTGIRVLELATGLAAPYATMFLADNGADVVKVEPTGGDPYRSDPGFHTVNRNKRSVVVADDELSALLAMADVIVVDGPGRAEAVRAVNPSAVVVSVPPWGERGPMVDEPSTPSLLHAATGMAWNQQSYGETPVHLVVPLARYATGVLAALAAATGLLLRATRGVIGPTYEVSEVAGAAALQLGESRPADRPPPVRPGDALLGSKGRVACYRLVEAGDGQWLFVACGTRRFYLRLLDVLGRPELIDDPDLPSPPWGLLSDDAIARLTPILDDAFASRTRDEWLDVLAAADVPAQPVLTREQFLRTSIVAANDLDVAVAHPEVGEVRMMGVPVAVEAAPGAVGRPAPLLDQHHDEVLDEWLGPATGVRSGTDRDAGHRDVTDRDASPPDQGAGTGRAPLAGLRVLDLAGFIAGPVVSRHLAMLGADVIKIEPPTGDPFRTIGPPFLSWNQGKRSIALDLTSDTDLRVVHGLARRADVVVESFRPGVARRLGVDRDTLQGVNPDLVVLTAPGYGRDTGMAGRAAFDPLLQAVGGLMAAQGGVTIDPGTGMTVGEPVFLTVPVHDVMTPLLGALGVVMGLHHRHRTGSGQAVHTSLAHSTMALQAAEYTRYAGRPEPDRGGFDHPGPGDGDTWFADDDGILWWRSDGDTVAVARTGLTGSELAGSNDLLTTLRHPDGHRLVVFGQLVGGAGPAPGPPPQLDQHRDEILAELGHLDSADS